MSRLGVSFTCALLLSASSAYASAAGEIEKLLDAISENNTALGGMCVSRKVALIEEAEAASPAQGPRAACRGSFSLDRELEGGEKAAGYGFAAMAHHVCLSFARSDPSSCAALKHLPPSSTGTRDSRCRWFYLRGAFLRSLLTDAPDAKPLCVASLDDPGTDSGDVGMGCGLIVKNKDDVETSCRGFVAAQKDKSQSLGPCTHDLRNTLGIGRGLTLLLDGEEVADYASLGAAYRRALRSGDPQACGDNHLCRALVTRDPAVCEPYAQEIRDDACARHPGSEAACMDDPSLERDHAKWSAVGISSIPVSDVFRYFVCMSFAQASPGSCRELNALQGHPPGADDEGSPAHVCRSYYAEGSLSKALIMKGSGGTAACEEMTAGMLASPSDAGKVCALLVNSRDDLASVCRMALPLLRGHKTAMNIPLCARQLRGLWGDREECSVAKDRQETEICELGRLLRKAGPQAGISACGDNRYCRALLGEGEAACKPFAQEVRRQICARSASPLRRSFDAVASDCTKIAAENEALLGKVRALLDLTPQEENSSDFQYATNTYIVLRRNHERQVARHSRLRFP